MTIAIGVVHSSAVAVGSAGYVQQFIDLPQGVIVVLVSGLALTILFEWLAEAT